jgi:hypothetical protein
MQSDPHGEDAWRQNATMSQGKETTVRRELEPDPDTAKQLLETAWPHCGAIQDIIDRLNEAGANTEPRLLANRLQRLVFRVRPVSSGK